MAKVIGVMGESGSGKTTSLRNLDPETTFYIDCDKKVSAGKDGRSSIQTRKHPLIIGGQTSRQWS